MSVLFVIPRLSNGGAERDVVNLANGLASEGMRAGIMTYTSGGDYERHVLPCVERHCIGHRVKTSVERAHAIWRTATIARSYDTIVSSLELFTDDIVIHVNSILRAMGQRKRTLHVVHITLSAYDLYTRSKRNQELVRRLYPRFDQLIAVSQGVKMDLLNLLGDTCPPTEAVLNPVEVDEIRKRAQEPLHASTHSPYFVAVGRLAEQKDYPTLLQAFKLLSENNPAHHLVILGRGPLEQQLRELAAQLGLEDRVHIKGFEDNPWKYMRGATALVVSSRYEGMSLVTAEALSCGTPVVATDCPHGLRELLEDGKHGLLVPVGEPAALADAMKRVIEHPEEAIQRAQTGLQSVHRFDSPNIIKRYRQLIEG